ncbi:MAG: hypothetical protein OHK0017_10890 [Patescibacteria group bacterium]
MYDSHAHLDLLVEREGMVPTINYNHHLDYHDILKTELWTELSKVELSQAEFETWIQDHDFIIQPTVSAQNLIYAARIFKRNPKIFLLLGSHPEIVVNDFNLEKYLSVLDKLVELIQEPDSKYHQEIFGTDFIKQLVGVGECGLDYSYTQNISLIEKQHELFEHNIKIALKLGLPLVIHTRDAWNDTWKILDKYPEIYGNFLIHCFTGNRQEVSRVLDRGGKIALGGILTFKNAEYLREAAFYCPIQNIVLETDLPFLAPVPYRGKTCMPGMIQETAKVLAAMKETSVEEVWDITKMNVLNLFKIK